MLIWIDLEMTGLNPEEDVILEIASIITDDELNIIAEGPELVIHQTDEVLAAMNPWCIEHHAASGLSARVQQSTISTAQAEQQTLAFLHQYAKAGEIPLCGNSIHQDRRFLQPYMPELEAFFHYRNIDVSSIKELVRRWYPQIELAQKKESHRALDDIRESIAELLFYRQQVFR